LHKPYLTGESMKKPVRDRGISPPTGQNPQAFFARGGRAAITALIQLSIFRRLHLF